MITFMLRRIHLFFFAASTKYLNRHEWQTLINFSILLSSILLQWESSIYWMQVVQLLKWKSQVLLVAVATGSLSELANKTRKPLFLSFFFLSHSLCLPSLSSLPLIPHVMLFHSHTLFISWNRSSLETIYVQFHDGVQREFTTVPTKNIMHRMISDIDLLVPHCCCEFITQFVLLKLPFFFFFGQHTCNEGKWVSLNQSIQVAFYF